MEHLFEFGVFFGKVLVVFSAVVGVILLLMIAAMKNKLKPDIVLEDINNKYNELGQMIQTVLLDKKELKAAQKAKKDHEKALSENSRPHAFVLQFEGDVQAHAVQQFRDEVSAILSISKPGDETIIVIESPGGTVHGYGLAAAQILRLRDAGVYVTTCVDKVAASGGYMMACTGNKILAAPFAIIGSIGVLAQVPNFYRILKKNDVDYEEITSGEYKRTVSMLGEITEKGRSKFKEQIEDTHLLFKEFVKTSRPQVTIDQVATGEYWFGTRAKELKLVDEIMTSDQYLMSLIPSKRVVGIKIQPKKSLGERIHEAIGQMTTQVTQKLIDKLSEAPRL